jgi:putative ABC transport system substrate-binding protein
MESSIVRLKVDVIVACVLTDAQAAQKATKAIPIVVAVAGDLVGSGLVESLARPGGIITGLTQMAPELTGKRLELLKEMIPKLSRVAVLWNPLATGSALAWKEIQLPARQLGIEIHSLEVRSTNDIDAALEDATRGHAGALFIAGDPVVLANLKRIADVAIKSHLPSIFQFSDFANVGGLVAYGPDLADMYRRAAAYVDKILKGAKPGGLPIEQPTKFEMVINMKTARALGIKIPNSSLVRADKVIE